MIAIKPDPNHYAAQLARKEQAFADLLKPFEMPPVEVFDSPPLHYRVRAEFKIWHEGDRSHYAVFDKGAGEPPTFVDDFPVASRRITEVMPSLLERLQGAEILRRKLFQVEFLSTLHGELLVTLVYHKPLTDPWIEAARALEAALGIFVIGRSRKQKEVLSRDYVTEVFTVRGREFRYRQLEGCFSQPNGKVCEQMLNWASAAVEGSMGSLLELYCGNGNFTLPLALHFDKVLATEISKPLTRVAEHNCEANDIHNIAFARMSAEEVSEAIAGVRPFRRMQHVNLPEYDFQTVFVDPPRAGLDPKTLAMVQGFANILYVSCNPHTLADNLKTLNKTHRIKRAALFDQFPYTDHMECGVYLQRRSS
ncbi:tRNA (uridine(54)-C5)-methyltransferase TrmA [Gilvimarinus sp. F26214L]|uniref:tRNA (uridine(54)-C5)-methyltransferase TrmA n=1 Tax=Gilvimarinus sp. DZF01 TaxID=3461371 RepID=UPI004045534B